MTTTVPHRTQFLPLAAVLTPADVYAADFTGSVVAVLDGDTLEVLHNQRPERIRLSGIDWPEKNQDYGTGAKHAVADLAFGKEVTIQMHGDDKYKRIIGDMILPDGVKSNQELAKDGWCWCWWCRKYAPGDRVLEGLETEAREAKKGLWADSQPELP